MMWSLDVLLQCEGAWLHLSGRKSTGLTSITHYKYIYIQHKPESNQWKKKTQKCGKTFQAVCDYGQHSLLKILF